MGQIVTMLLSVAGALAVTAVLFIGADRTVDSALTRWPAFMACVGAVVGLIAGAVLQHNGWVPRGPAIGGPFSEGWLAIVIGGIAGAALGMATGRGLVPGPDRRIGLEARLRPWVFVGPALLFVTGGLVIPGFRTLFLSFKNGTRGQEAGFTFRYYEEIFTDRTFFSVHGWSSIFTSRLFIVALAAAAVAGIAAWASASRIVGGPLRGKLAQRTMRVLGLAAALLGVAALLGFVESLVREPNRSEIVDVLTVLVSSRVTLVIVGAVAAVLLGGWLSVRLRRGDLELDWGSPTSSLMLALAIGAGIFGVLSTLQGVVWNNIWWVVTVAGLSTVLGLLLAILAERARGERVAKTLIFMPMAISMVGAAVIWDFIYEVQPTGNQTGLLNAILQGLGFQSRGFFINSSMIPWNNFWIMFIMVWIQTGFAMVVLSAAIRAVPEELTEAARVDGANEIQVFWRVVIPQIRPTIIVVVTTLMVIVTKVFDLVKATTNGANRTNVLANEMFDQLRDRNFTSSSAFAVVLLALVLPVMIYNIRRLQSELK
ncbi:carbohydrate ABC transporter permease [Candidatus Poriferisocius sp.]|uniref:carbohydrate ABC transporter permease n=1 Tax=Candidatus Poriferisocius sp. TaxID=3101276 RepID=UPI003B01DDA5